MKKIGVALLAWVAVITAAHLRWNVNWSEVINDRLPEDQRRLMLAYVPVT